MRHPATRNTIFQEEARVLEHQAYPGDQYVLRLHAPETAAHALPGSFIHLQCAVDLPMRRPMSIMRADKNTGWIDILYKIHGDGSARLAQRRIGDLLNLLGPIGQSFKLKDYRKYPLLIGGGVGIPPMVFLAEHIRKTTQNLHPLVIMGSEIPFPFKPRPTQIMVNGIPEGVIASMPLLEDWGIASRLASLQGYAGCFEGYVTELARHWLDSLAQDQKSEVEVFACGPTAMLKAVSLLAYEYTLPCEISLEEYMACAVGGCAGCAVEIRTDDGPAMKRVCVDGPVFEAASVFPQTPSPAQ
jgi:dihydroorotate dehydrogenase electron transfer subunit